MLRTQVFRLLCQVAWLLILNILSEQRESLTLLFSVKSRRQNLQHQCHRNLKPHTTSVFRSCYHINYDIYGNAFYSPII